MKAIRFVGSGGQGIQLAAVILAEASIRAGRHVASTQTYGPESRGGASRADVLIGDTEIVYPRIAQPDVLVVLSGEGGRRDLDALRSGGILICERSISILPPPTVTVLALPIVETAKRSGSSQSANIVALGVLSAVTEIVSREHLVAALQTRKRSALPRNERALDAGIELGRHSVQEPVSSVIGVPP